MSIVRKILSRLTAKPSVADELHSLSLRKKYADRGVDGGMYSYGCFDLDRFPSGTKVGRYCSMANSSRAFRRNHGVDFIGLTAFFYNSTLGVVDQDTIEYRPLNISDDVWLGHNSIILPNADFVGRGAIVAAGAIVTKSVPAYAIVAGNPAKVCRMRFSPEIIKAIEESRWWELDPADLRALVKKNPEMTFRPDQYYGNGANNL